MQHQKTCDEWEELISRAIDGECTVEEAACLRSHLDECHDCRETLRSYALIDDVVLMHSIRAEKMAPAPDVSNESRPAKAVPAKGGIFAKVPFIAASVAACALFFFLGETIGRKSAAETYASRIGAVTATSPAMWTAGNVFDCARTDASIAERPFSDSIKRYRSAVADELRKFDVDWDRARELLEAVGELRTDIELLTLHLAYLDIEAGRSRDEVADHWESLGGVTAKNKTELRGF